jgi:hypothetical protein
LLLCVGCLAGCYPITELQSPSTLPVGQVQTTIAQGLSLGEPHHYPPETLFNQNLPIDLAVHVGVEKNLELGFRIRPLAAEVQAKYQLLRDGPELSACVAALVAGDFDNPPGYDDNPGPVSSAVAVAGRFTVYVGTDARASQSLWIAPTLTVGARSFPIDSNGSNRSSTLLLAPGVLTGILLGRANHNHVVLEVGVMIPVGGVGKYPVSMTESQQTRLGPGDTRVEFALGYAFGEQVRH